MSNPQQQACLFTGSTGGALANRSFSFKRKGMPEAVAISVGRRIGLLIAAFSVALGVGFWGLLFAWLEIASLSDAMVVMAFGLAMFPGYLLVWPMLGLLPDNEGAIMFPAIIGWFIYIGLGRAVIKAPNRSTWERLFALFVLLLCANVAGCWNSDRL